MYRVLIIIGVLVNFAHLSFSAPTRVGNGDDGSDLESFIPLEKGKIVETRKLAVQRLKSLRISSVKGLGQLIPEVSKTDLYMTKKNLPVKKLVELGAFTNDENGVVYARTFPRAHAATRFFPAAQKLDEKQLIALHIHEGLHRALEWPYNEDEAIVSSIALAINDPATSFDQIQATVSRHLSKRRLEVDNLVKSESSHPPVAERAKINAPSQFLLGFSRFNEVKNEETRFFSPAIQEMYTLKSYLYPFGGKLKATGIGIDLSLVNTDTESYMGPLGLSLRHMLWTGRGFDFEGYLRANLNTLSNEELENSFLGRDVVMAGFLFGRRADSFYVENELEFTAPSEAEETIGNIDYKYQFGTLLAIRLKAGAHLGHWSLGGFFEMLLSDSLDVSSEASGFRYESGRNRLLAAGPQLRYTNGSFILDIRGRYLLNSTQNTDFDFLGDLMGYGVGQGSLSVSTGVQF